jgi:hypothetical protein
MGAHPITNWDAKKVCTLSGLEHSLYTDKLITLKDAERSLVVAMNEARSAQSDSVLWSRLTVAAKIVKLTCDVAMEALAKAAGPKGEAVNFIYARAPLFVDMLNSKDVGTSVAKHIANTHGTVAEETLKAAGKTGMGRAVGALQTLINLGDTYLDLVEEAHASHSAGRNIEAARRAALGPLERIRAQIAILEKELEAC